MKARVGVDPYSKKTHIRSEDFPLYFFLYFFRGKYGCYPPRIHWISSMTYSALNLPEAGRWISTRFHFRALNGFNSPFIIPACFDLCQGYF